MSDHATREWYDEPEQVSRRLAARIDDPCIRVDPGQSETARRLWSLLCRWQELDRPLPTFRIVNRPVEEWLPEFELFLSSYVNGGGVLATPNDGTEPRRASDIQPETKSENGVGSIDLLEDKQPKI